MDVMVYDATGATRPSGPLSRFTSVEVHVGDGWTTDDVIGAADLMVFASFALVTDAVRDDVANGIDNSVSFVGNLIGITASGTIYYPHRDRVLWVDFLRAVDEGFFSGDPTQVVVFPWGVAGGWAPDGLWGLVQYLFEHRDVVVETYALYAAASGLRDVPQRFSERRKRAILRQWNKQGFTAPKLRRVVARREMWDPERFAQATSLTVGEAIYVLINLGYERRDGGLYRRSDTSEANRRRDDLDDIERRAQERGPGHERDWPDDLEDND